MMDNSRTWIKAQQRNRDRPASRVPTSSSSTPLLSSNGTTYVVHRVPPRDNDAKTSRSRQSNHLTTTSNSKIAHKRKGSTPAELTAGGGGNNFAKFAITAVMVIAIADMIVLWASLDATIGNQIGENKSKKSGPELSLHRLTQKIHLRQNFQQLIDLAMKPQHYQTIQQDPENHEEIMKRYNKLVRKEKVVDFAKVKRVSNTETHGVDEHIVKLLTDANIPLDEELAEQLPTWDDIVSMYGDKPIVYGLETCQTYRDTVKPEDRMLGPAGIFNTGTNLLFELMKANCDIKEARNSKTHTEPKKNGMRFQPPWGKHNPPSEYRNQHVAKFFGEGINQLAFFPVVMIKDFYHWSGSQCRHEYTSWWAHDKDHCPNLVLPDGRPNPVGVKYGKHVQYYSSILDLWNKYYQEWEEQTFPHLTTRYEDLLFHGEEVTRIACDCIGGVFTANFGYVEGSAKENGLPIHEGANGLIKSLLQYGSSANRLSGFTDQDRLYASKHLDSAIFQKYGYSAPPLPT